MNGSDIAELIRREVILDLSKEIPIKRIPEEDEPIREESENESLKAMWNIKIDNHMKREKNGREREKGICGDI